MHGEGFSSLAGILPLPDSPLANRARLVVGTSAIFDRRGEAKLSGYDFLVFRLDGLGEGNLLEYRLKVFGAKLAADLGVAVVYSFLEFQQGARDNLRAIDM